MATKTTSEGVGSNPEVPERAKRRRFTAEYKLGIVHGQTPKSAAILPSSGLACLSYPELATSELRLVGY